MLGFESSGVRYTQSADSIDVKFILTEVYRNHYKDPDTVDYIREAKEQGLSSYQQLYDEFNAPHQINYDIKVTARIGSDGTIDESSIEVFNDVSPTCPAEYMLLEGFLS